MTSLATAFVTIKPDTKGFAATLGRDVNTGSAKAGKDGSKHLSQNFVKGLKGLGAAVGATFAVAGAVSFFKSTISEATEAAKVGAQTAAVLKSTGGAAGVTRKHIEALATALSNKVGIDDEAIQSGSNVLLTFRNIRNETGKGNDVFDQATKATLDMSVALGKDLRGSSILVGKALNDPVKGMSALGRSGVQFTEGQKETVKRMVATGNTMGAQKLILRELNAEFKGSAEAQAQPAEKAKVAWDNFKETLGTAVLPIIGRLADLFTEQIMPAVNRFIAGMKDGSGAGGRFAGVMKSLGAGIAVLAGFLWRNKDALVAVAAGLATYVIGMKVYAAYTFVVTKATAAWSVVQRVLNGSLRANPVGIVVTSLALLVGGLVLAYKKSDTFRAVVDKAWSVIRKSVRVAWTDYIRPALTAMNKVIANVLVPTVRFLWNRVVSPIFSLMGKAIRLWWTFYVRPAFQLFRAYLNNILFPVIRFLWHNVVQPVFAGIGQTIGFVWRNVIAPVFTAIKKGIGLVGDAFSATVTGIKTVWETLKAAVKVPVRFAVNVVAAGLVNQLNKIPFVNIKVPHVNFDVGGYTGPGTKHQPAGVVHAGEFVSDAETTSRARPLLEVLHRTKGRLAGFAQGGSVPSGGKVVWPTTGRRVSTYPGHDGIDINAFGQDYGNPIFAFRAGRISYAGWGKGYGHAIFESTRAGNVVYGHASRVFVHSGQVVNAGQRIGLIGSTGHSSGPHLHFGIPGGTPGQASALLRGSIVQAGGGGGTSGYDGPSLGSILSGLNPAKALERLRGMGPFGAMLAKTVTGIASTAKGFATRKIGALMRAARFVGSGIKSAFGALDSLGSGTVKDQVRSVANILGWGRGAEWTALSRIIASESGWNPRAANAHSSARGLFQKMTSLHGPIESTVQGQAKWGLNYIRDRYGDPISAWAYHRRHGSYDAGGIARGAGYLTKATPLPERVLSPRQTVNHERLTDVLETLSLGRGDGGDTVLKVYDADGVFQGMIRAVADERIKARAGFDATRGRQ